MNIEIFREYCLSKPHTSESLPFDDDTLVFKVLGKMFALANISGPLSVNLKCDPEKAIELREQYECITPGYHMNKKHWNSVLVNGTLPVQLFYDLIDHSYELVLNSIPKSKRNQA